jgi:hypothetical protein
MPQAANHTCSFVCSSWQCCDASLLTRQSDTRKRSSLYSFTRRWLARLRPISRSTCGSGSQFCFMRSMHHKRAQHKGTSRSSVLSRASLMQQRRVWQRSQCTSLRSSSRLSMPSTVGCQLPGAALCRCPANPLLPLLPPAAAPPPCSWPASPAAGAAAAVLLEARGGPSSSPHSSRNRASSASAALSHSGPRL